MKNNQTFLIIGILIAVVLFTLLGIGLGRYASSVMVAESPNAACAVTMTDVIASAQGDVYNMEGVTDYSEPDFSSLATYSVQGDAIINPILKPSRTISKTSRKMPLCKTKAGNYSLT